MALQHIGGQSAIFVEKHHNVWPTWAGLGFPLVNLEYCCFGCWPKFLWHIKFGREQISSILRELLTLDLGTFCIRRATWRGFCCCVSRAFPDVAMVESKSMNLLQERVWTSFRMFSTWRFVAKLLCLVRLNCFGAFARIVLCHCMCWRDEQSNYKGAEKHWTHENSSFLRVLIRKIWCQCELISCGLQCRQCGFETAKCYIEIHEQPLWSLNRLAALFAQPPSIYSKCCMWSPTSASGKPQLYRRPHQPRLRVCRYVRTLGTLPVNSPIWDGGSIHDERRTRHSTQT